MSSIGTALFITCYSLFGGWLGYVAIYNYLEKRKEKEEYEKEVMRLKAEVSGQKGGKSYWKSRWEQKRAKIKDDVHGEVMDEVRSDFDRITDLLADQNPAFDGPVPTTQELNDLTDKIASPAPALTDRQRSVLGRVYYKGNPLEELGEQVFTREEVRISRAFSTHRLDVESIRGEVARERDDGFDLSWHVDAYNGKVIATVSLYPVVYNGPVFLCPGKGIEEQATRMIDRSASKFVR